MAPIKFPVLLSSVSASVSASASTSASANSSSSRYAPFEAQHHPNPSFEVRPDLTQSLPGTFRKNMKDITTSFGTTEEEFDALPLAVRRKYFSTYERLKFAQNSRSNALNGLPIQHNRRGSLADRRGLSVSDLEPRRRNSSARRLQKISKQRQQSVSDSEASWYTSLPEKIQRRNFSREEQVVLAGRLRESVILDAADEAIVRRRRASRVTIPPTIAPLDQSISRSRQTEPEPNMADTILESIRWDQEPELDLALDDYHAALFPTPKGDRRPSFRRQISISKIPFGRASTSSTPRSPLSPKSPKLDSSASNHNRTRARALSLITPKHTAQNSVSSMDPNVTHYQDPEARLKLRVYLASPQKFDEAIEFGFPSMDMVADNVDKENRPPRTLSKDGFHKKSATMDTGHSFFDDVASLFEDDVSMADPDSPLTPLELESGFRSKRSTSSYGPKGSSSTDYSHLGITKPTVVKPQDSSYTQAMAGNREFTLRMTLTRPDLRADETAMYGWQTPKESIQEEPLVLEPLEKRREARGPFGGIDGWGLEKENGVVKRFWKKVKSL